MADNGSFLRGDSIHSIVVDPTNPDVVYAGREDWRDAVSCLHAKQVANDLLLVQS